MGTIYTTYEKDCMNISEMQSSQTILPTIGGRAVDLKKEEWTQVLSESR